MAATPVLIVGSATGANRLECSDGSATPVLLLSASLAGSEAPSMKKQIGTLSTVRPYWRCV